MNAEGNDEKMCIAFLTCNTNIKGNVLAHMRYKLGLRHLVPYDNLINFLQNTERPKLFYSRHVVTI